MGAVRPRRIQRRLLRRAGTSVPPRSACGRPVDSRPGRVRDRHQDLPVLRTIPVAGATPVDAVRRRLRRATRAGVDADRIGRAVSVVGPPRTRRSARRTVGRRRGAFGSRRRPVGDRDLHGGGGLLACAVRRRVGQRVPRDRTLGAGPRDRRRDVARRVGCVRLHRPTGADGHRARCAGHHADACTDRRRGVSRADRLRAGPGVASPIGRLARCGRGFVDLRGRRRGAGGAPRCTELCQVREPVRRAWWASAAVAQRSGTGRLVRRQQRELLLVAVPAHHVGAVLAAGCVGIRASRARDPVRAAGDRPGELPGREHHPGDVDHAQRHAVAALRDRGRGVDAASPVPHLAVGRCRHSHRHTADVHDRIHRQPLPDRHAATAGGRGSGGHVDRARSAMASNGQNRRCGVGCLGSLGQRRARHVDDRVQVAGVHRAALRPRPSRVR